MGRAITTAADMGALLVGSIVSISGDGVMVNTALKTEPDNWALAGQVRRYSARLLFRSAIERDGRNMNVLYEATE